MIRVTTVAMDSVRRRLPDIGSGGSVLEQEVEDGVGEKPEDQIIERRGSPASVRAAPAAPRSGEGGRQQLGRPDDHRQQQRQRDQRARSGRARGSGWPARRRACRRPRSPTSASSEHQRRSGRARAPVRSGSEQHAGRTPGPRRPPATTRNAEQRERLGDEHRGAVDGRQQEAVEAALLVVGDEQAVDAEDRAEQQRDREDAGGQRAVDGVALQARSGRRRAS